MAVSERVKRDGEWTDTASYFDVIVWGKQAENANAYLQQGRGAALTGRLRSRQWTTDTDEKRYRVEIHADQLQLLGAPKGTEDAATGEDRQPVGVTSSDDGIPY